MKAKKKDIEKIDGKQWERLYRAWKVNQPKPTSPTYEQMRDETLKALRALRTVCYLETKKMLKKAVAKKDVDLGELHQLAMAYAESARAESYWLGVAERLTQAEIDFIIGHDGELPPGMTIETLFEKMGRFFGISEPAPRKPQK